MRRAFVLPCSSFSIPAAYAALPGEIQVHAGEINRTGQTDEFGGQLDSQVHHRVFILSKWPSTLQA